MKRKSGMSIVEFSIVLAIVLLLAAVSLPTFFQNRKKADEDKCVTQLDAISVACQEYAREHGGFPKTLEELVPDYLESIPVCPAGGTYTLGTPEGSPPTCSIPSHHL